ncbi:MAG: hypothetical protein IT492_03195 [Gammaproteobacteria bacterium]|nr:hypothetical protein [Gammaproteobacteria bacterium]
MKKAKPKRDLNQLAKLIVDIATGEEDAEKEKAEKKKGAEEEDGKNPAAVALGRLGGLKGGKARAAALSPKKRSAIAKKAAAARWKKDH